MKAIRGLSHTRRNPTSRLAHLSAATLLAIGAACTNSNEPRGSVTIEPASTTISMGPTTGFVVPVTITNTSTTTIYGASCGFNVEQSKLGGDEGPRSWVTVWSPVCALELPPGSPMTALEPGQSVTVTVDTRGSGLGRSTVFDGQYRVKFGLYAQVLGRFYLLSDDQRVSTPFSVI